MSLYDKFPQIAKEWDSVKNVGLTAKNVKPTSNKAVWWICFECGYSYKTRISNRVANHSGCPQCREKKRTLPHKPKQGKSFGEVYPLISEEWDFESNKPFTPQMISYSSNKKVWWRCPFCKELYEGVIQMQAKRKRCPICKMVLNNRD